jgi:ubiquinone/menaquinone biosynthesis C-methylase UbiE
MEDKIFPGGRELLDAHDLLATQLGINYGAKVADLGCGSTGYFAFQAAQVVGDTGIVYAVDILKLILKNIENRAKMFGFSNIKTVWSNLENYGATEINDSSVDYAFLVNILFQNKRPETILRESVRILRKGGKLLVVDWKHGRFPFGPAAESKVLPARVRELALGAGLKEIKEIVAGKFHYGIIFEKI